jgi:hypothetical protein
MALPEIERHRADKLLKAFCDKRIPPHSRDQVKLTYKVVGNRVTLIESRPYYNDPSKWSDTLIAQFEYDASTKSWSLYAFNRHSKRLPYSKGLLEKLIEDVDKDPYGIFWG